MLLLEKLESESAEDLRVYMEALVWAIWPKRSALVSKLLPLLGWKTLLRVGAQIQFMGKTFCSIEWVALRIYVSLRSLVEDGAISRDAIVLYQRPRTGEEIMESGSLDTIVLAFLVRGCKAKRVDAEEVLAALPPLLPWDMLYHIGRDLDDGDDPWIPPGLRGD